ncbi:MAG: hypothetical protein GC168_16055 [Candidatus Hydrogenedens sp.]|nr:hypothetical protein [Candidatus Hydrogenedens sp.]
MRFNRFAPWALTMAALYCTVPAAFGQGFELKAGGGKQWFKGNTHTHTLWSDGEAAPEFAAKWYKDKGYNFLCLSDHNILSDGSVDKWVKVSAEGPLVPEHVADLRDIFGSDWVEIRPFGDSGDLQEMRLKTLDQVKSQFEEAGKFLMIQAEEITCFSPSVHVGGINLRETIAPVNSSAPAKSLFEAFNNVRLQSEKYDVPMVAHLNHPNWDRGVPVQDIIAVPEAVSFEVFNGHPGVRNWGNESKQMVNTDRIWDVVLAHRLMADANARLLGYATDDTHDYFRTGPKECNPGRGWVMVLAPQLTPELITASLDAGLFYSTTGVLLESISANRERYEVTVAQEPGVNYTVQFIGTRKGFDPTITPRLDEQGNPAPDKSSEFGSDIGVVLAETTANPATYTVQGDELYVRAKIVSDKVKENPFAEGDMETAWTQPLILVAP